MTAYKLLLVPEGDILSTDDGKASVRAESSVCNCDEFKAGPFAIIADIPEDGSICMSRTLYETVEVTDP